MTNDTQIIKCRDDKAPVFLTKVATEAGAEVAFKLASDSACSWLPKDQTIAPDKLRPTNRALAYRFVPVRAFLAPRWIRAYPCYTLAGY